MFIIGLNVLAMNKEVITGIAVSILSKILLAYIFCSDWCTGKLDLEPSYQDFSDHWLLPRLLLCDRFQVPIHILLARTLHFPLP
jgi:hypothetical protein